MIRNIAAGVVFGVAALIGNARADTFTPAQRAKTLDDLAGFVEMAYVHKDVAKKTADEMRGWKNDPALLAAADQASFASLLTDRLRKIDGHFNVAWGAPMGGPPTKPGTPADAELDKRDADSNYGFETVQRLPGNIGYIKLRFFDDFDTNLVGKKTPPARRTAESALQFVQSTDAVIFDIRNNGGGSPAMIDLLLAAFFGKKPVLLNRFYNRHYDNTTSFTTLANYTGVRRPNVPIYVLTNGATGSAAEEFAYDLQTQKRGLIVGETTYGGANPGVDFDAGDGFSIFISTGMAINPITHTNWEGVGVKPDVAVPSAEALARAETLALNTIIARGGDKTVATEAQWTLDRMKAAQDGVTAKVPQDFVGSYGTRQITLDNGTLFYKRGMAPSERLIPLGDDMFALEAHPDQRMTFPRGPNGHVTALSITDTAGSVATSPASPPPG